MAASFILLLSLPPKSDIKQKAVNALRIASCLA